jgi:dTDP-4-amino-4,6-dideoxygalactose transaminase/RimJ/RimL family protein N-acetyltransferase
VIPIFKPYIGPDTLKSATDALDLGWLGMGSYVKQFEEQLAGYLEIGNDRKLVAVNTCTSALHLALLIAGVDPGDEVITPALNNIGDFQAIGMTGARPVFCDIREDNLGIDPEKIEPLITHKTKAIIVLHYSGIPCNIEKVFKIAKKYKIRVVEDAAHAIGTRVNGKMIGGYGDLACFSFDAIKTLTCIDGGAVVVNDQSEADRLYSARLLGMTQKNAQLYTNSRAYKYDVYGQGFRYHLANLHASVGLSQLNKLPEFIANRQKYCLRYNELLKSCSGIITPRSDYKDVSPFNYVIRVPDGRREDLMAHLKEHEIDTGIHWIPGNRFTWLKKCRGADNIPVTDKIGEEILTLPLWSYMPDEIISRIADLILSFFKPSQTVVRPDLAKGPDLVKHIKAQSFDQNSTYRIQVPGATNLCLRVVSAIMPADEDVKRLTEWRNKFSRSFLTEFIATYDRTRAWLTNVIARDNSRILFMIEEPGKLPIGYIGMTCIDWTNKTAEADSVVRGEDSHPGMMMKALKTLLQWAGSELGINKFKVRVISDNPAVRFYSKFGFKEMKRVALRKIAKEDCQAWEEISTPIVCPSAGARQLIHMELVDKSEGIS